MPVTTMVPDGPKKPRMSSPVKVEGSTARSNVMFTAARPGSVGVAGVIATTRVPPEPPGSPLVSIRMAKLPRPHVVAKSTFGPPDWLGSPVVGSMLRRARSRAVTYEVGRGAGDTAGAVAGHEDVARQRGGVDEVADFARGGGAGVGGAEGEGEGVGAVQRCGLGRATPRRRDREPVQAAVYGAVDVPGRGAEDDLLGRGVGPGLADRVDGEVEAAQERELRGVGQAAGPGARRPAEVRRFHRAAG